MGVRIERTDPRHGEPEVPLETARGFELVDSRFPGQKGGHENATFIR